MFWDKFVEQCISSGKSPTSVVTELGFSPASVTQWKNGSRPRLQSIYKIAEYFGVSPDVFGASDSSTFYKNLCYLCSKTGESPNSIALECGLTSAVVTGWINGRTPRETTLKQIAAHFNLTTDELLSADLQSEKEKVTIPQNGDLKKEIEKLVDIYTDADAAGRRIIWSVVQSVASEYEEKQQQADSDSRE